MSLETLKDVKEIGGYTLVQFPDEQGHEQRNCINFVQVNHDKNEIRFTIQDGPIKEVGVNGCQVDTIIETAKIIIEGLNKKFPNIYNENAISSLKVALRFLENRKLDREKRGVEGYSLK